MFYISEIKKDAPEVFKNPLQEKVYQALAKLEIPYERVETDEAITMNDCVLINERLNMNMVKTVFLCNKQQTAFYLFITCGDKKFSSKNFSKALGISRVSFAPSEKMTEMPGTVIGAATVFSALLDSAYKVQIVFDRDVVKAEFYGCSDGTTTGYMKIRMDYILCDLAPYTNHQPLIIEVWMPCKRKRKEFLWQSYKQQAEMRWASLLRSSCITTTMCSLAGTGTIRILI